jgi:acyl-CoA synthetase (AMP-forming)/AMP-acid ligase II
MGDCTPATSPTTMMTATCTLSRKKDVIIRGGNNIHAADVESALLEHPGAQEAAVAGIPHSVLSEDVAAFVVPRSGNVVDADRLRLPNGTAQRLQDPAPDHLRRGAPPRDATGKVLKHELVEG